eukprot:scaffold16227_cov101-Isochrysis_galbana.AAC.1
MRGGDDELLFFQFHIAAWATAVVACPSLSFPLGLGWPCRFRLWCGTARPPFICPIESPSFLDLPRRTRNPNSHRLVDSGCGPIQPSLFL